MPTCSIKLCSAGKNIPGLSLHKFPTNEIQRRKWLEVIGIKNINTRHKVWRVCSLHFDDSCFNKTLGVIRLRDGAIPSSPVPNFSEEKIWPWDRQKNMRKKSCRGCLSSEVKLFSIQDNDLANIYEQLVGIPLEDNYSQHLCGICATMLRKFAQFRERCQKAYSLLSDEHFQRKTIKDTDVTACIPPLPYSKTDIEIHEYIYTLEEYIEDLDSKQEPEFNVKEECNDFENADIDEDVDHVVVIHNIDEEDNVTESRNDDDDNITVSTNDDDEIEDSEIKNVDSDSDEDNMTVAYLVNDDIVYKKEKRPKIAIALKNNNVKETPKPREIKRIPKSKEINETSNTKKIYDKPKTQEEIKALADSCEFEVKFLTEEEQYEEIEERKRQARNKETAQCDYCGKTFPNEERLEIHFKRDHDPSAGTFVCNICYCRFSRRSCWTQHMTNHQVFFQCKNCTYNTKWHYSLMSHSLSHKGKVRVCEYCQKECSKVSTYFSHVRLQHASELPWCEICGESFVKDRGVKLHMIRAHKGVVLRFECSMCDKKFTCLEALDHHVRLEKCDLDCCVHCGEGFASLQLLKYHLIQVHAPESLSVNCKGCNVKFHSSAALQRHLWKCGKAVCCVQCGEHFDDESLMRDHVVKEHSDFKCEECNKSFSNAFYYKYHVSKHGGQLGKVEEKRGRRLGSKDPGKSSRVKHWRPAHDGSVTAEREPRLPKKGHVVCEICGMSFRCNARLEIHIQTHSDNRPFHCDQCPKAFKTSVSLQYHLRVHTGERPFQCTSCPKAFKLAGALARHTLVHSGVRKHVCQICKKTFSTSTGVKMHIKYVHMKIPAPPRVKRRRPKSEEE